jgi:hypothetical protein
MAEPLRDLPISYEELRTLVAEQLLKVHIAGRQLSDAVAHGQPCWRSV